MPPAVSIDNRLFRCQDIMIQNHNSHPVCNIRNWNLTSAQRSCTLHVAALECGLHLNMQRCTQIIFPSTLMKGPQLPSFSFFILHGS
jgi:hypothetical protein